MDKTPATAPATAKSDAEWRSQLSPEQYAICRCSATERAFTGKFWDHKADGVYTCVRLRHAVVPVRRQVRLRQRLAELFRTGLAERGDRTRRRNPRHAPRSRSVAPVASRTWGTCSPMARRPPACVIASIRPRWISTRSPKSAAVDHTVGASPDNAATCATLHSRSASRSYPPSSRDTIRPRGVAIGDGPQFAGSARRNPRFPTSGRLADRACAHRTRLR
jgi:hypothetical protein